ncbi:GH-E family nuclease [Nocardia sp. NPDC052112]|uniref:GH-E family nuclease n=1 Tax=Nocardia sp. NPDC052112 TaxID=3155646 RepID=UPI003430A771
MIADEMVLLGLRLVKGLDEVTPAIRKPLVNTVTELRTGNLQYIHYDQLKTPDQFRWKARTGTPPASPINSKPAHITGKLNDWVYENKRPGFPAKTKNDVFKNAEQLADGRLLCDTTKVPVDVIRKPNGEPQYFELNNKGHAKKAAAPESYKEWKAKNEVGPTEASVVNGNEAFTKPAPYKADIGHPEGGENWRLQQFAIYHKIDEAGYKDAYVNLPEFRFEERSANRGHGHESTEPGYGIYAQLAEKYPPLPGAPDPTTIVKGLKKPGSGP